MKNLKEDPVKKMSEKYPRVLVIKAMMQLMKEKRRVDEKVLEDKILSMLKK